MTVSITITTYAGLAKAAFWLVVIFLGIVQLGRWTATAVSWAIDRIRASRVRIQDQPGWSITERNQAGQATKIQRGQHSIERFNGLWCEVGGHSFDTGDDVERAFNAITAKCEARDLKGEQ